jgi:hypothetical protein
VAAGGSGQRRQQDQATMAAQGRPVPTFGKYDCELHSTFLFKQTRRQRSRVVPRYAPVCKVELQISNEITSSGEMFQAER